MLVVQDVGVAGVLRERITEAGYRPICACDVSDALEAITHERPAVVVVEVGAPCVAGRALLAKLDRARPLARIPRLVIEQRRPHRLSGDPASEPVGEDGREPFEISRVVRQALLPVGCARPRWYGQGRRRPGARRSRLPRNIASCRGSDKLRCLRNARHAMDDGQKARLARDYVGFQDALQRFLATLSEWAAMSIDHVHRFARSLAAPDDSSVLQKRTCPRRAGFNDPSEARAAHRVGRIAAGGDRASRSRR
ncbi:MAG TPA: hypothetical protein VIF57_04670 [Polyangia bacterium]